MSGSFHCSCDFFVIPWGMRWEINKYNMWRTGKWKITEREEQHGREHPTFCAGFGLWPFQRLSGKFRKRFWVVGFFSPWKNNALSMALLFFFLSDGRLCCFRCVSFKSSKGQLKQGEAFPFPTHTLHKIKPLLYKWCSTTKTLKDASRTHIGYFFFYFSVFPGFMISGYFSAYSATDFEVCTFFLSSSVSLQSRFFKICKHSSVQGSYSKMCLVWASPAAVAFQTPSPICSQWGLILRHN